MKFRFLQLVAIVFALSACSSQSPYTWEKGFLMDKDKSEILNLSYCVSDGIKASYEIDELNDGVFAVKCKLKAGEDIADAHISIDITVPLKSKWWMLPAVSYNGNQWGTGNEPKGASDGDNGWWTYSYRRSPIPGAIYSENQKYAVATWSDANEDFSYSIMPENNQTAHRYIWPEEEMPRAYTSRDVYSDGWQKHFGMKKGETHLMTIYICVSPTECNHHAVSHFIKSSWDMAKKVHFDIPNDDTLWNYGIRFAKESLWDPTDQCIGFRTGLTPDLESTEYGNRHPVEPGTERKWRKTQGYAGGWVGRNIYIGCAMLSDYILNGDEESLEIGLATLDHWAKKGPTKSGLIRSYLPEGGIDACNMGTEMLAFRDACKLAEKCGYSRPEYMKVFLDACNTAIATQREDGCYPRNWSVDEGKALTFDGFTSAYIINPMLEAYKVTNDNRYLVSAQKAYDYFIGMFNSFGYTTAGALDTNCIDKESSHPLFAAAYGLYLLLHEKKYLDDALALGYYISTWQWCYDGVYPADDSFTKYNFHTFGGTSVSTQHQCLDNFGIPPVPIMRELAKITGDNQWNERADAMYNFCCQLISDGELEVNGRIRPVGGQCEAYFQAEWYLYGNKGRFDNWLVAWPSITRLEYQMDQKAEELGL